MADDNSSRGRYDRMMAEKRAALAARRLAEQARKAAQKDTYERRMNDRRAALVTRRLAGAIPNAPVPAPVHGAEVAVAPLQVEAAPGPLRIEAAPTLLRIEAAPAPIELPGTTTDDGPSQANTAAHTALHVAPRTNGQQPLPQQSAHDASHLNFGANVEAAQHGEAHDPNSAATTPSAPPLHRNEATNAAPLMHQNHLANPVHGHTQVLAYRPREDGRMLPEQTRTTPQHLVLGTANDAVTHNTEYVPMGHANFALNRGRGRGRGRGRERGGRGGRMDGWRGGSGAWGPGRGSGGSSQN